MALYPRRMPQNPRMFRAEVAASERTSPSFQRVTLIGPELDEFEWSGFDHWFRFFLPPKPGVPLRLPQFSGRGWWLPYLAIPSDQRPHCSNYTVAEVRKTERGVELDVDVVLHWDAAGALAGGVATWATSCEPGSPVGLLDQGLLFDPPGDATGVHLITDETGLPAIRGILRDLPADTAGTAIIEVPHPDDVETLTAPAGVSVTWLPRHTDGGEVGDGPIVRRHGTAALDALQQHPMPGPNDYAFVVGESSLATGGRRALHRAGLPKARITFSGFWKAHA